MRRFISFLSALVLIITAFSSCSYTAQKSTPDTTEQNIQTYESAETTAPAPEHDPSLIHGIETFAYPSPYAISEYNKLTDDQKIAFDALAKALTDAIANGAEGDKHYPLAKRITWIDYKLAYDIFRANFTVISDIVGYLFSEDSYKTQDHVDGIYLYNDKAVLDDCYQKYIETDAFADEVLASLEHDGSDYGKALAIAKWMADNIVYPEDYLDRTEDYLNTAYTALIKKEAVCDGYAKAYDFLCKKAGLETIYITGETVPGWHAWNMICINEKWYHVDVTWMYGNGDFYRYFMMPDELCKFFGHETWTYYYAGGTANISYAPEATSYDLYKQYYASCEDFLLHFSNTQIKEDFLYLVCFNSEAVLEKFKSLHGTKFINTIDKETYYISFGEDMSNDDIYCIPVVFLRKYTEV